MKKDKIKSGKRWTDKDRNYIKDNYLKSTNEEISIAINRTMDAVRKEFNKMGLKRPRKYEIDKIKSQGVKDRDIFKSLREGEKRRKLTAKEVDKVDRKIKVIEDYKSKKPKEDKVYSSSLTEKDKVPVYVDSRTTIYAYPGQEAEALEKYKKFLEKRSKF